MDNQYPCLDIENEIIKLLKELTYEQLVELNEYIKTLNV